MRTPLESMSDDPHAAGSTSVHTVLSPMLGAAATSPRGQCHLSACPTPAHSCPRQRRFCIGRARARACNTHLPRCFLCPPCRTAMQMDRLKAVKQHCTHSTVRACARAGQIWSGSDRRAGGRACRPSGAQQEGGLIKYERQEGTQSRRLGWARTLSPFYTSATSQDDDI